MDFFEMSKAVAMLGASGGGGSNEGNLIQSDVKQGYYVRSGELIDSASDSVYYCAVEAEIEDIAVCAFVCADLSNKQINIAYVYFFGKDGTYISNYPSTGYVSLPLSFSPPTGTAVMRIMVRSNLNNTPISPDDIGVPTLVKI